MTPGQEPSTTKSSVPTNSVAYAIRRAGLLRRRNTNHVHSRRGSAGVPVPECSVSLANSLAARTQKQSATGIPHHVASPRCREVVRSGMKPARTVSRYTHAANKAIESTRAPPRRRLIGSRSPTGSTGGAGSVAAYPPANATIERARTQGQASENSVQPWKNTTGVASEREDPTIGRGTNSAVQPSVTSRSDQARAH